MSSVERLSALLADRAEHLRNAQTVATATQRRAIADGLAQLAQLYHETASSVAQTRAPLAPFPEARTALIERFAFKARNLANAAMAANDERIADQMRSLAAICAGEVEYLNQAA